MKIQQIHSECVETHRSEEGSMKTGSVNDNSAMNPKQSITDHQEAVL